MKKEEDSIILQFEVGSILKSCSFFIWVQMQSAVINIANTLITKQKANSYIFLQETEESMVSSKKTRMMMLLLFSLCIVHWPLFIVGRKTLFKLRLIYNKRMQQKKKYKYLQSDYWRKFLHSQQSQKGTIILNRFFFQEWKQKYDWGIMYIKNYIYNLFWKRKNNLLHLMIYKTPSPLEFHFFSY